MAADGGAGPGEVAGDKARGYELLEGMASSGWRGISGDDDCERGEADFHGEIQEDNGGPRAGFRRRRSRNALALAEQRSKMSAESGLVVSSGN